jgi:hypothetical protein
MAQQNEPVTKYIGDFLGFKLFAEQNMPKESLEHMEKKLNLSMDLFDIPVGFQYSPFRKPWVDLTDDEMLMIYGQQHEGKKYSLGRMVQQTLKDKNL